MAYKSKLQELCHKNSWNSPLYTTHKDGFDHCPCFTATVVVNGMPFESPLPPSKSSKEAQNRAAQHALEYLSSANNMPPTLPPSPSSPTAASSSQVVIAPSQTEVLQQNQGGNSQINMASNSSLCSKDASKPKDLHLYKSRLQHYTQKNSRSLPDYSCEFDGPPHARRFRARVTIDGKIYQSSEYYPTLKDAEHAAAKVALESLSVVEIPENEGLFKTLLQEWAQKNGLPFPVYSTAKVGVAHIPTFLSRVEVGGKIYAGKEFKTKKQSEMSAAKIAYNHLIEGEVDRRSITLLPAGYGKEPSESSSKFHMVQENPVAEVGGDPKMSSSENLPEAFPPPSACSAAPSGETTVARDESSQGSKVLIFRRGANMELPENAEILQYCDDKWMAVRVRSNQDPQLQR